MDSSHTTCLVLLVTVISVVHSYDYRAICKTGRLYLGTVDENYPYKLRFNGVFELTDQVHLSRPVYKHEALHEYLYYFDGAMGDGYWAIGPEIGSEFADFSIRSVTAEPETADGHWRVHTEAGWISEERINLSCVDEDFFPCTTGKLLLSGISKRHTTKQYTMGEYELQDDIKQLRPVYKHTQEDLYIYFANGLWLVGNSFVDNPDALHSIFVHDAAFRPELISQDWVVFNQGHFSRDKGIQLKCLPPSIDDITGVSSVQGNVILAGSEVSEDFGLCLLEPCLQNSTCTDLPEDRFLCGCDAYTVGPRCEEVVLCPELHIRHGNVIAMTSQGFLGLAAYQCHPGFVQTTRALVCDRNSSWQGEANCIPHPELPPDVLYDINDLPHPPAFQP